MMEIKVFGQGADFIKLTEIVEEAVNQLKITDPVKKVSDIKNDFMGHEITATPALAINGKVEFAGRVPGKDEIITLLYKCLLNNSGGCRCGKDFYF